MCSFLLVVVGVLVKAEGRIANAQEAGHTHSKIEELRTPGIVEPSGWVDVVDVV